MKISIITCVYNGQDTISDTIQSVLEQDYADIEYIVIDGKSSDNTLSVINRYKNNIHKVVSEKDEGIYDAINKGISYATGDVIGILHADDVFADNEVISRVAKAFENTTVQCSYGDLVYTEKENTEQIVRYWKAGEFKEGSFKYGWMPPHPTFFVRTELYTKFGAYRTELKTAADYELMLRFLYKFGLEAHYIPETLVKMRVGGASNKNLTNRLSANQQDRQAWSMNEIKPSLYTLWLKPIRKISQYSFYYIIQKLFLPILTIVCFVGIASDQLSELGADYAIVPFFSWSLVILTIPAVRNVAVSKGLFDLPNFRSSHFVPIPSLGGISVYFSSLISICLWGSFNQVTGLHAIIAASTIIFFLGLKDDLLMLDPRKKFIGQLIASFLVVYFANLKLDYLFGLFGLESISPTFGAFLSCFSLLVIVNAFNLIDGIDGLASGIGVISSAFFGFYFVLSDYNSFAFLALSLLGSLLGFIKFNFSRNSKIFLGDSGSMLIGLLIGFLALKFIEVNEPNSGSLIIYKSAPFIAFCVLGLPLFDLLRVMSLRIIHGKSPFFPDKNHIHHLLLGLGLNHFHSTLILLGVQAFITCFSYLFLNNLDANLAALVLLILFVVYVIICKYASKKSLKMQQTSL